MIKPKTHKKKKTQSKKFLTKKEEDIILSVIAVVSAGIGVWQAVKPLFNKQEQQQEQ